ncbi:MAG TPA: suppressor of fused domain protein [Acidimicrobiales bacterium]|nr:suppressor of fused domain protein [Acidimicrobiales bacterium]
MGAEPRHVFSPRKAAVDEVRLYAVDAPTAWVLVTLGLADQDFELTLRLPRDGDEMPTWAVDFLLSLAAYCRHSKHGFVAGDHIDLRGPMKLDVDTAITAAVVTPDPTLQKLGAVEFLRVVGLTADELELCRSWQTAAVVDLLRQRDPELTTDLERSSLLDDSEVRAAAEAGVAAEGSLLDSLRVASLGWRWRGRGRRRVLLVSMGSGAATALGPALRRTLTHEGAEFVVEGDAGDLCVRVGAEDGWQLQEDAVVVAVAPSSVEPLADLFDGKTGTGGLPTLAGLRFAVVA